MSGTILLARFRITQVSVQRHLLTNKIVLTRHITVIHHQKRAMKVYSIIIYPHVPIPPTPSSSSLPQDIFPTTNQLVPKKYLNRYFLNNDAGTLLRLSPLYQHIIILAIIIFIIVLFIHLLYTVDFLTQNFTVAISICKRCELMLFFSLHSVRSHTHHKSPIIIITLR